MKNILIYGSIVLMSMGAVNAQQDSQDNNQNNGTSKDTNTRFWEAKLPGGEYIVALNRITSISKHSYFVGSIEVTEVVIDTDGNSLARFYAFNMAGANSKANIANNVINRGKEILNDQKKRAGVNGNPVTKNYPNTTHAKTVEYLLTDANAVNSLMNSAKRAWTRNRGGRFTIK